MNELNLERIMREIAPTNLRAWVQRHFPTLSASANDLVHETYLKVQRTDNIGYLEAYLWKTLRNLCINEHRKRSREVLIPPAVAWEIGDDPLPDIPLFISSPEKDPLISFLEDEERALILRALELVDNKSSRAILLALALLSHEEIGKILTPEAKDAAKNAAVLRFNGIAQLKRCIKDLSSWELTPLSAEQFAQDLGELIHQRFGLDLERALIPVGLYEPLAKVARRVLEGHRTAQTRLETEFILARCCYHVGLYTEAQNFLDQLLKADVPVTLQIRVRCDFARLLQEQPLRHFRQALWRAACGQTWALDSCLDELPRKFADALQQSEELLMEAQELNAHENDPIADIYLAHRSGNIALLRKEMETALNLYDKALRQAQEQSWTFSIHHLHKAKSKVKTYKALQALASGDQCLANSLLEESERLLQQSLVAAPDYRKGHADVYVEKGIVAMVQGQLESVCTFFRTAFVIADQIGTPSIATDALHAMRELTPAGPLVKAVRALAEELGDVREWATVESETLVATPAFNHLLDAVPGLRAAYEKSVAEARERECEAAFWRVIFHTLRLLIYADRQLQPFQFDEARNNPRGLWRITESRELWAAERVVAELAKRYRRVEEKIPGLTYLLALLHDGLGRKAVARAHHERLIAEWIAELPLTLVLQSQTEDISDAGLQTFLPFVAKHSSVISSWCFRPHKTKETYLAFRLFADGQQQAPALVAEPAKRQFLLDLLAVLGALDVAAIRDRGEWRNPAQLNTFLLAAEALDKQLSRFWKDYVDPGDGQSPQSLRDIATRLIAQRDRSEDTIVERLLGYIPDDCSLVRRAETEDKLHSAIGLMPVRAWREFCDTFSLVVELKYLDNVALPALLMANPSAFLEFLRAVCTALRPQGWVSVALADDIVKIGDHRQAERFVERFLSPAAVEAWAKTASFRADEWVVEATYNLTL